MEFYKATDGGNWHDNDGWGESRDTVCSWHGITCRFAESGRLEEIEIRLAENNLTGGLSDSLSAIGSRLVVLDVSGNRLEGPLPTSLPEFGLKERDRSSTGGLDICWNDFDIPDGEVAEWVAKRHMGGSNFQSCLGVERQEIGLQASGTWYDPAHPGKGISIQWLHDGRPLVYWFTFGANGEQRWLFEIGKADSRGLYWPELLTTEGRNDEGGYHLGPAGSLAFHQTGQSTAVVERHFVPRPFHGEWLTQPLPLDPAGFSDRIDYQQLSMLAGTTCENQQSAQWMSGVWSAEDELGGGIVVEVFHRDRALVYWFTHSPRQPDRQLWMMGVGTIKDGTIHVDEMIRPTGPPAGPGFDADEVRLEATGSLTLDFSDPLAAHVHWEGLYAEWDPETFAVNRLTRPKLAECE